MFAVEISKGENIAIEDDAPEVAYHLFRIICLLQGILAHNVVMMKSMSPICTTAL